MGKQQSDAFEDGIKDGNNYPLGEHPNRSPQASQQGISVLTKREFRRTPEFGRINIGSNLEKSGAVLGAQRVLDFRQLALMAFKTRYSKHQP